MRRAIEMDVEYHSVDRGGPVIKETIGEEMNEEDLIAGWMAEGYHSVPGENYHRIDDPVYEELNGWMNDTTGDKRYYAVFRTTKTEKDE